MLKRILLAACITAAVSACSASKLPAVAAAVEPERLEAMVKVLASDEFEGRAPGTAGEDKTVAYLIDQFEALGVQPGGPDGQWTQAVPMMRTFLESPEFAFTYPAGELRLVQGQNVEVSTVRATGQIHADNVPIVFVGFGVTAPERDWDDYGDVDLTGKIAVYLVNDPDFAAAPGEPVAGRFGYRRMTYYGRWAYKYEEAARRGALGALVIHETEAAGYDWSVAAAGAGERVALASNNAIGPQPIAFQGWLEEGAATELLAMAGHDLPSLRIAARQPGFTAFELDGVRFRAHTDVKVTRFDSRNVLGLLPGSARPDEVLMVSAHWDAYGEGPPDAQGKTVRAGANDDALGTAGVLEIARVLKAGPPLERSVVFALWTAEESGLVGSKAYAVAPVYPLATTVASFTLDILQTAGEARDVILVGEGQSSLEDDMARIAAQQGRYVTPENLPENGLFYRADHFSLARAGVPVLLLMGIAGGADLVDGGRAAGNQWIADYVGNCYHKPCDAWSPDWNLTGAVQDIELFRLLVEDLGNSRRWPEWRAESEFKAVRDVSEASRR